MNFPLIIVFFLSGSDGLVKLWTIKSSECVRTFDEHDAKVWALCVSSDESKMVSGAADGTFVQWQVRVIFVT